MWRHGFDPSGRRPQTSAMLKHLADCRKDPVRIRRGFSPFSFIRLENIRARDVGDLDLAEMGGRCRACRSQG